VIILQTAIYFFCFIILISSSRLTYSRPITPECVLSKEELDKITKEENFFLFKNMDNSTPIWRQSKRKYSNHYLKDRDQYFDMREVVRRVLLDGFPIQYKLEKMYRDKLGLQVAIGNVIPRLHIGFGEGAGGINIGEIFLGLFNFLLPANWMKISNQKRVVKISQYMLFLTVFNEILGAKLAYIKQHQLIQEFEIINYYFIHLQILAKRYQYNSRAINTLIGKFSVDGTDMASQRGKTKLGYNDLALMMALEHCDNDLSIKKFNIKDLDTFPSHVPKSEELDPIFQTKEKFLQEVVKQSVELKTVQELYKISKLNIGITAFGSSFSHRSIPGFNNQDARFALGFGYGTIPRILISKSLKHKTEIDVRKEYLKMIHAARTSYDLYTNSLGGYIEAKRSLELNRKAFIDNLTHILNTSSEPDSLFIFSLNHLIKTELKLNNALHGFLKAKAHMERFVLWDKEEYLSLLPSKGKILKTFEKIKYEYLLDKDYTFLDQHTKSLKRSHDLEQTLYQHKSIDNLESFEDDDILDTVKKHLPDLLLKKKIFGKSSNFYKILKKYINEHKIELTSSQSKTLSKRSR
jgi:hypothetical protein